MKQPDQKFNQNQGLQNRINKQTDDILAEINHNLIPVSFSYENSFVSGDVDADQIPIPEISKEMQEALPTQLKGQRVCKLEVKALENYKQALKKYISLQEQLEGDKKQKKKKDDKKSTIDAYDRKVFKIYKPYLTMNQLLFGWDQGKQKKSIRISEYNHIFVQERKAYEVLKNNISNFMTRMQMICDQQQKNVSFFHRFFNKQKRMVNLVKEKIQLVRTRAFFLTQKWDIPDLQSAYRIICIHKNYNTENGNFYIYFNTFFDDKQKIPLQSLQVALKVKDLLVVAYMAQKNRQNIRQLNNQYKQNTKRNLLAQMVSTDLVGTMIPQPEIHKPELKNSEQLFEQYRKNQLQQMINKWKQKSKQLEKYNKTYLFLQSYLITIPKSIKAKSIKLYIDKQLNSQMKYSGQDDYSWIFKPRAINKVSYDIENARTKVVNFQAQIEEEGGKKFKLRNNIKMSKIQNQALGFSYQLGLIPDNKVLPENFKYDFPYVLIFDAVVQKTNLKSKQPDISVRDFRLINLLSKLGKIPNLYSSYFSFKFHPNMVPIISQILNGKVASINKKQFEQTYIDFLNFFQHQQNKSQNFCLYLKMKNIQNKHSGFIMQDRLKKYRQKLKISQVAEVYKQLSKGSIDNLFIGNFETSISRISKKKYLVNLKNDLSQVQMINKQKIDGLLKRYIIFCDYYNKKYAKKNHQLIYNANMIKIADKIIEIYERSFGDQEDQYIKMDYKDLLVFFTAFIMQVYPYHRSLQFIQKDLYHIRVLAQSKLKECNYILNRRGVGLENFAASHLLTLFTNLPMQLCLRIWDLFIINLNKNLKPVRILTVYTLLLYQQKSDFTPIYPINRLIQSAQINFHKIKLDQSKVDHFVRIVNQYNRPKRQRNPKIQEYAKQKYLRRFAYGRTIKQIDILDQDQLNKPYQQKKMKINYSHEKLQNKLLSLNQLNYPLPRPNYQGSTIQSVYIFIGGLFILKNINFHRQSYKIQINLNNGSMIKQIPITDKNIYLNQYLKLQYEKQVTKQLQVRLLENNKEIMLGILSFNNYHKDNIYKQIVYLKDRSAKYLNNLGVSTLEVTFILRNVLSQSNDSQANQNKRQFLQIQQKLLDYDLEYKNNSTIKAMKSLNKTLGKILNPLDQLNVDQYPNLKLPIRQNHYEAQWIKNSQVSIEELKAILNAIFTDDSQKHIRLKMPNIYEHYSENLQSFNLGKFLMELTLMTPMSTSKKISMLYCFCAHYQNVCHPNGQQKITIQTLNSLLNQIYLTQGILNICPFSAEHRGEIIYACYYEKGEKVEEQKKDITDIIQDWFVICEIYSDSLGIMFGSSNHLTVLKSMFPVKTLKKIQEKEHCRFQITYRKGNKFFIWSSTIKTQDFEVVRRGVKFLNSYPKYNEDMKYFDSIGEILMNCQNYLPLHSVQALSYEEFYAVFRKNPLLYYILGLQNQTQSNSPSQNYILANMNSMSRITYISEWNQHQRNKEIEFTDFAIFRHQNCYPQWKRCRKIKQQEQSSTVIVKFQGFADEFQIPVFQLISMQQNLNQDTFSQSSDLTISR